jgi:hypothetical protein
MLFLISCEWTIVSYYQNTNIILASEKQRYTFTFAALIMNIFNALFLVWVFLDKNNPRLVNYLILLFIINIIIGLISCSFYDHLYYYGRFNNVIIVEFQIFIIKCAIFLMYMLYISLSYLFKKNDNIVKAEYSEVLIAEAVN